MAKRFHMLFFVVIILNLSYSYSQNANPSFEDFKKSPIGKSTSKSTSTVLPSHSKDPSFKDFKCNFLDHFRPVFQLAGPPQLVRTQGPLSFSSAPSKKPIFCRMEDNISNRYNFQFQLRAGTDEQYRNLAFPRKVEKRNKLLE